MKVKKPTSKSITDNAVLVGSAATGAVISKGVVGLVLPNGNKLTKASVLALVTAVGAAAIKGTGKLADSVRGLFAGMSIQQTTEVISEIAKKNVSTANIGNAQLKSFVNNMFEIESGLAGMLRSSSAFEPKTISPYNYNDAWDQPLNVQRQSARVNLRP